MTTTSELRAQLENKGEEISQITHKIEERIESYTDWPGIVREHPFQSIGAAALVGVVLSGSTGSIMKLVGRQAATLLQAGLTAAVMSALNKSQQTTTLSQV
jgi:hypothetical protein